MIRKKLKKYFPASSATFNSRVDRLESLLTKFGLQLTYLESQVPKTTETSTGINADLIDNKTYIKAHPMDYDLKVNNQKDLYDKYEDYTRYRTFELIAEQIIKKGIPGDVAEAGVFAGDFAWIINTYFHDKNLYLYDTFSGFDMRDLKDSIDRSYMTEAEISVWDYFHLKNYTPEQQIELVKSKMPHPDKCFFRKGFFPDSANNDTEKTFAFVSIDLDLYQPVLEALKFFYPRLESEGYIFLHDYSGIPGIKDAIEQAEITLGYLPKVPISDRYGTIVINKP